MTDNDKPLWGMGWDHQEPAAGRNIYRWTKPGYKYHILWDGVSLWYGVPFEYIRDKNSNAEDTENYMVFARKKDCEPNPDEDEGNDYSIKMVYFPRESVPNMLLFGRDCFEKGFAAATREISRTISNINHKTQL